MKTMLRLRALCFVFGLILIVAFSDKLQAQQASNNPTITLPENGIGTIQFAGGVALPLPGVLAADPGPGGLPSALTYNLLGPPALVAGDVFLLDLAGTSDIIRFNPAGTGGNPAYPASAVFYSLLGAGELADTGFPSAIYTNTFALIENESGATIYTPTANQPGFVPGFGVTYDFFSGPASAVPDAGSSALLLGLGLLGVVVAQRALGWQQQRV